jgi:DNA polymerase-3 subunit alpha
MRGPDGARLNVRECYPLEGYISGQIRKVTWLVQPESPELPDFFRRLRTAIDAANGETKMEIAFAFPDRVAPVAEMSFALKWRVGPAEFQALRSHPAVVGTMVEPCPPELKETRRWGRRG